MLLRCIGHIVQSSRLLVADICSILSTSAVSVSIASFSGILTHFSANIRNMPVSHLQNVCCSRCPGISLVHHQSKSF